VDPRNAAFSGSYAVTSLLVVPDGHHFNIVFLCIYENEEIYMSDISCLMWAPMKMYILLNICSVGKMIVNCLKIEVKNE
jgi:hypothetical protein